MSIPALFSVTHQTCNGFTEGSDGNSVRTYGDPVQQPAIGWGPHSATGWSGVETRTDTTYLETVDLDLFLPKTTVGLKDLFTVDSVVYEVVDVADWTKGFHGWEAGVVVALSRWEG